MKICLAVAALVALFSLAGCSYAEPAPECSKRPDLAKLNPSERLALKDALVRYAARCNRQDYQCDVSLTRNSQKEILVTVASVYPHRASGHCVQAFGDRDLGVYSPAGTFIRRVMSL
jgi:hypothetical protein